MTVLDAAPGQLPVHLRARDDTGRPAVLVRTDAAGATKEFVAHLADRATRRDPTVSRLITTLADDAQDAVAAIGAARANARERVWNVAGRPGPGRAGGDRSGCHSARRALGTSRTRLARGRKGSGSTPLLSFVDHGGPSGGEPAAQLLRPGKAGSNTAADHVTVLDAALAQLPAALRASDETGRVAVLVRTDAAGATKEFAAHLHEHGVEFSVGASCHRRPRRGPAGLVRPPRAARLGRR